MTTRNIRLTILTLALLFTASIVLSASTCAAVADKVYLIDVEGTVTAGMTMDIQRGLERAEDIGASAVILRINTPGGMVESMEGIISTIDNSKLPVITYVPRGARAFSAGAFMLLSGHVAAMAPGTATGAATPIAFTPEGATAVENKTVNAFAARIRGIAEIRGKPADIVETFVRDGISLTASEALNLGVIDIVADDEETLLSLVDGKTVKLGASDITLHTDNSEIVFHEKNIQSSVMSILGDPQLAFILMMIGIYGLIFGLASPGTYIPEMIGAIALLLALYGLGIIGVSTFGAVLIIAAVILFVAELLTPTYGALTVGAIICLVIGALTLPQQPLPDSGWFIHSSWYESFGLVALGFGVASAAFFLYAIREVIKIRTKRATTGTEELIGKTAKAMTDIAPEGSLNVHGEIWKAESETGESINEGEVVTITQRDGLTLKVRKVKEK